VGGFLLQRNIKIVPMVTFSRFSANRYNAVNIKPEARLRVASAFRGQGSHDAPFGFSGTRS
jgi:hypothetical protein